MSFVKNICETFSKKNLIVIFIKQLVIDFTLARLEGTRILLFKTKQLPVFYKKKWGKPHLLYCSNYF